MTATHLQHVLAAQIHLRGDAMVQLNARAVRLILRRQRQVLGRVRLEGVVEKVHAVVLQTPGQKRIPEPPEGLAHRPDDKEAFEKGHANRGLKAPVVAQARTREQKTPPWRAVPATPRETGFNKHPR